MSTPVISYRARVNTPCSGEQLVIYQGPGVYAGNGGSFTFVTLTLQPGASQWVALVYDFANPTGLCFPSRKFLQVTPNASDPEGAYWGQDSTGQPDQNEGTMAISLFP